jgi:16S rRNA (cytosine967-C5)-methyltransferase
VALHRLEARPETAHTIVNQAVEAAAHVAGGRFKGLVNGVLRNALRQDHAIRAMLESRPETHWRHPQWWIEAVQQEYPDRWQAVLVANNGRAPMSLRVNCRRSTVQDFLAELRTAGLKASHLGAQGLQLEAACPVAGLHGFADGRVSVQDWGAQQAAVLLDVHDGQRALDACAAPGGKTAHILELADVDLLALELEDERAARVRENLDRLGLAAAVKTADCRQVASWWNGRPFDRILADVPCSASGVVRRHPDIKWLRRKKDVVHFAAIQAEILESLWPVLAPGGKMLYVTCSVFGEENGQQIARFAARHPDCRRLCIGENLIEQQWLPTPHHDGFYYALLGKAH